MHFGKKKVKLRSVDPDETSYIATFHQNLCYLPCSGRSKWGSGDSLEPPTLTPDFKYYMKMK